MADFAPRASINEDRSRHPDLNDDGEVFEDVYTTPDARERDFNRNWQDPGFRENYMQRVEAYQRSLPVGVQRFVQAREYSDIQAYRRSVDLAMDIERGIVNANVLLTDVDIERMDLDEFNHYFDANGTPKPGVHVHLMRGQILDSGNPT